MLMVSKDLAQPPPGPISRDRLPYPFRGNKADAGLPFAAAPNSKGEEISAKRCSFAPNLLEFCRSLKPPRAGKMKLTVFHRPSLRETSVQQKSSRPEGDGKTC